MKFVSIFYLANYSFVLATFLTLFLSKHLRKDTFNAFHLFLTPLPKPVQHYSFLLPVAAHRTCTQPQWW